MYTRQLYNEVTNMTKYLQIRKYIVLAFFDIKSADVYN